MPVPGMAIPIPVYDDPPVAVISGSQDSYSTAEKRTDNHAFRCAADNMADSRATDSADQEAFKFIILMRTGCGTDCQNKT